VAAEEPELPERLGGLGVLLRQDPRAGCVWNIETDRIWSQSYTRLQHYLQLGTTLPLYVFTLWARGFLQIKRKYLLFCKH
jgi:hypothetical protein